MTFSHKSKSKNKSMKKFAKSSKHSKNVRRSKNTRKNLKKMRGGGVPEKLIFKINKSDLVAKMKIDPNFSYLTVNIPSKYDKIELILTLGTNIGMLEYKYLKIETITIINNNEQKTGGYGEHSQGINMNIEFKYNALTLNNDIKDDDNFFIIINKLKSIRPAKEYSDYPCLSYDSILILGDKQKYNLEQSKGEYDEYSCKYNYKTTGFNIINNENSSIEEKNRINEEYENLPPIVKESNTTKSVPPKQNTSPAKLQTPKPETHQTASPVKLISRGQKTVRIRNNFFKTRQNLSRSTNA